MSNDEDSIKSLLDWTAKQGRILTANGLAEEYYTPERGFPFKQEELPHFHLLSDDTITGKGDRNNTHAVFSSWAALNKPEKQAIESIEVETTSSTKTTLPNGNKTKKKKSPVCGAWTRPLFVGGFEHSTNEQEIVFNVQTNALFIDMRIPRLAKNILPSKIIDQPCQTAEANGSLFSHLSNDQLRLYARRHAFAGYTILDYETAITATTSESIKDQNQSRPVCTRHHCIDWNLVGRKGRNRPNKWFVEMHPNHSNIWKELSYATDNFNQHYYWERWERLENDSNGDGLVLALRQQKIEGVDGDCIIAVVGDHFNYIFSRSLSGTENTYGKGTLVNLVDAAIEAGDRQSAESYLTIDAGHGTISSGWVIDCALQYWKEGTCLFSNDNKTDTDTIHVNGASIESCHLSWKEKKFEVYESSLISVQDLNFILQYRGSQEGEDNKQQSSDRLFNLLNGHNCRKRKLCSGK